MKVLITGTAGFIGFHLANKLIARGDEVIGLDCISDYYDPNVKYGRLDYAGIDQKDIKYNKLTQSSKKANYRFIKLQLEDKDNLDNLFELEQFDSVCNLAAQAGVRYSIENPMAYIDANIIGFINILESCRNNGVKNLSYASSSSVYGLNESYPFSTFDNVDHPMSLYAATKKSNELMAHTYSHLYGISTTGLRFFTVYGPWGRPDMALFKFTRAILSGEKIQVYNYGKHRRDFTYIDDIVEGVIRVLDKPAKSNLTWSGENPDSGSSNAPWRIYNIGNNSPVELLDYIKAIEHELNINAIKELLPLQPGDVPDTFANVDDLVKDFDYKPNKPLAEGVKNFVDWYKEYFDLDE